MTPYGKVDDMTETVPTRHRVSGVVDVNTPLHIAQHPVLGRYLDIVEADAKPYTPELYKSHGQAAEVALPENATVSEDPIPGPPKLSSDKKNGKD